MDFPIGLIFTWLGIAGLWVAFHGTNATTPWGVFQDILGKGQSAGTASAASGGTPVGGNSGLANNPNDPFGSTAGGNSNTVDPFGSAPGSNRPTTNLLGGG